ncbi:hypothetical protein PMAYCL1PPCAC_13226 [Pristionchus mayeri]|uniref:CHK kinase-like domain-containing protein n=1 Tax=Pristionchus mayeri TaxID=1317129 RepID=A0AAN4ZQ51_9BILA|nr:hypothetical protein PMAYCL1PPCAC_13226 [Pristionchus mayeri]
MNFYERHSVEQVKKVARALGKMQARSLSKEPTAAELKQDFFKKIAAAWPMEIFRSTFKGVLAVDDSEKTKDLIDKIDSLVPTFYGSNLPTSIHRQMNFRPVLVNGDLHTGNILIDKDTRNVVSLIDFQGAHFGVGVEDLHRIAISSLTTEERRASIPFLVKEMHDSLMENLDGVELPYSLEKLLLISDLIFPQCALLFVGQFTSSIAKTNNDAKLSDAEKKARIEVMMDKIIGTLEDVIQIIAKNEKHMANLKLVD